MTSKKEDKNQQQIGEGKTDTLLADVEKDSKIEIKNLVDTIFQGYGVNANEQLKDNANALIGKYIKQVIDEHECIKKYNPLILYDSGTMIKSDADNIYNSITSFKDTKPLLLVLYSNGGVVGSAYLIGKLCRENSNGNFAIVVPRHAKSAATLLCCAADEIHMGSLSELGPIDPQIKGLPALGLKNSIKHIAMLVKETPESSEMFAKYLHYSLKPIDLGYYERVAESAMQYAQRLLAMHADKLPSDAKLIARTLVYAYKDHSFVIDKGEAASIFGDKIIKTNTMEYSLGNSVYKALSFIEGMANFLSYNFYFIGSLDAKPNFTKRIEK